MEIAENALKFLLKFLLFLFHQETQLESAQNFSRQISRHFSPDVLQLQMPNFVAFFTLQTFVSDEFDGSGVLPRPMERVPGNVGNPYTLDSGGEDFSLHQGVGRL